MVLLWQVFKDGSRTDSSPSCRMFAYIKASTTFIVKLSWSCEFVPVSTRPGEAAVSSLCIAVRCAALYEHVCDRFVLQRWGER